MAEKGTTLDWTLDADGVHRAYDDGAMYVISRDEAGKFTVAFFPVSGPVCRLGDAIETLQEAKASAEALHVRRVEAAVASEAQQHTLRTRSSTVYGCLAALASLATIVCMLSFLVALSEQTTGPRETYIGWAAMRFSVVVGVFAAVLWLAFWKGLRGFLLAIAALALLLTWLMLTDRHW